MALTLHAVEAHLPRVLAQLACLDLESAKRDWVRVAQAGEFETCARHTEYWFAEDGQDMLNGACRGGHLALVKHLLARGEQPWNRALQRAVESGNIDVVHYLLPRTLTTTDTLHLACRHGYLRIARLLLQYDSCVNLGLSEACASGHLQAAQLMIEHGATDSYTGIFNACKGNHLQVLDYMLERWPQCLNYALTMSCALDRPLSAAHAVRRGARVCGVCCASD